MGAAAGSIGRRSSPAPAIRGRCERPTSRSPAIQDQAPAVRRALPRMDGRKRRYLPQGADPIGRRPDDGSRSCSFRPLPKSRFRDAMHRSLCRGVPLGPLTLHHSSVLPRFRSRTHSALGVRTPTHGGRYRPSTMTSQPCGRGGAVACPGRKPKGRRGRPSTASQLPGHLPRWWSLHSRRWNQD